MKTELNFNSKRSITELAITFTVLMIAAVSIVAINAYGNQHGNQRADSAAHQNALFATMDTVVVTAPRLAVGKMDTIVVTASRWSDETQLAHAQRVKTVAPL